MGNLSTNGARIAAIVVAVGSIGYGLFPKTYNVGSAVKSCGTVLFPSQNAFTNACGGRISAGLLWVIIVVTVAASIYFFIKEEEENK